ncbi:MAG: hypothetical protein U0792_25590 [Gemmataceae bacterium]
MAIVIQEILQDKIYLDASGNLQASGRTTRPSWPTCPVLIPACRVPLRRCPARAFVPMPMIEVGSWDVGHGVGFF